jgi:hypothetical protein
MAQQHPYGHLHAILNADEHLDGHHHASAWAETSKGGGIDWATVAMYTTGLALDALIILGAVKLLRKLFS